MRHWGHWIVALGLALGGAPLAGANQSAPGITVFAASSLTDVVRRLAADFTHSTGIPVRTSFAASSALARQITSGAPADLFISADVAWMDDLQRRGLIRAGTRRDLVGNRLVLIAPKDSRVQLRIAPRFALAAALGDGRLAVGDPDSVPVGRYARAALTALGVWPQVANRLVRADNVRVALEFVARGEVPLGIVYSTDAAIDPNVRVVGVFPASTHPPIVYPAALTSAAKPDAARLLDFLEGPAAAAVFEHFGFAEIR